MKVSSKTVKIRKSSRLKKKTSKKMGRPRKEVLSWKAVELLAKLGASQDEICAAFKLSPDTLLRRVKAETGLTFAEWKLQKSDEGKAMLRSRLWQLANCDDLRASVTMGIWLSKNWLGFSDKHESKVDLTGQVAHVIITEEQRVQLARNARIIALQAQAELTGGDLEGCPTLPPSAPTSSDRNFNPDISTPME